MMAARTGVSRIVRAVTASAHRAPRFMASTRVTTGAVIATNLSNGLGSASQLGAPTRGFHAGVLAASANSSGGGAGGAKAEPAAGFITQNMVYGALAASTLFAVASMVATNNKKDKKEQSVPQAESAAEDVVAEGTPEAGEAETATTEAAAAATAPTTTAAAAAAAANVEAPEAQPVMTAKEVATAHRRQVKAAEKRLRKEKLAAAEKAAKNMFTLEEVRADHGEEVWVTLKDTRGVYNVSAFLDAHPGGADRIRMVNGQDLSAFWAVYSDIHNRAHIRELLEEYRIGSLSAEDAAKIAAETVFDDVYKDDPPRPRSKDFRIASTRPWNSEPKPELLVASYFTPNDLFFVRNHNNVPDIDEEDWELEILGNDAVGMATTTFTLKDLKTKFEKHEIVAALQCAGNRQDDFVSDDRPLYVAPHWRNSAIGNARWAGVKVRDLLEACGMDVDAVALRKKTTNGMQLVNFVAEDVDETGTPYAAVIPIEKAIDPFGDAILAYEMNGETLPRDHGFPVRLLAPGTAGCRNPKWVRQVFVSAEASELDSGSRLDRHFAPDISWQDHREHIDPACPDGQCRVRIDQGPVIQTLPVQSIICVPGNYATISGDTDSIYVKGIAYSGAGRGICRVELSLDGGSTFTAADLIAAPVAKDAPPPEAGMGRNWAWQLFERNLQLPDDVKQRLRKGHKVTVELISKAIDGDFNSQPESVSHVWNVLGICVNHWCRTKVTLDPSVKRGQEPPVPALPSAGSCVWPDCPVLEGTEEAEEADADTK